MSCVFHFKTEILEKLTNILIIDNMCLRPLKIKNPKLDFNILNDKKYLYVPCGHCSECLFQYQSGYVLRAYYEHLHTIAEGGSTYYYTLTFNNDNLPKCTVPLNPRKYMDLRRIAKGNCYSAVSLKYDLVDVPCFDKKLVQLFLRRLDARIYRKYHCGLRYFIVSEFGENTHRPHHHALFYTSTFIDPHAFRQLLDKTWLYGFNRPGENFGLVQNVNAVKYCAKYVSKDLKNNPLSVVTDDEEYKNCLPFHLQSQGFGLSALTSLSELQSALGLCNMPNSFNSSLSDSYLPTYLLRKLYYNVEKNINGTNSYVLNDAGKKRALRIYDKNFITLHEQLDDLFKHGLPSTSEFKSEFSQFCLNSVGLPLPVTDFKCLFDSVTNCDIKSFIDYVLVLRGRSAILPYSSDIDSRKLFIKFLTNDDQLPFEDSSSSILYDSLDQFTGYDCLMNIFNYIVTYKKYVHYKQLALKYNSIQTQRFNAGRYSDLNLIEVPNFLTYQNM